LQASWTGRLKPFPSFICTACILFTLRRLLPFPALRANIMNAPRFFKVGSFAVGSGLLLACCLLFC